MNIWSRTRERARLGRGIRSCATWDLGEFCADWKSLSRLLFVKGASWEYEREIRLLVDLEQTRDTGRMDRNEPPMPIKVIDLPPEAIREIYGGENTQEADLARAN